MVHSWMVWFEGKRGTYFQEAGKPPGTLTKNPELAQLHPSQQAAFKWLASTQLDRSPLEFLDPFTFNKKHAVDPIKPTMRFVRPLSVHEYEELQKLKETV